MTHAVSPLAPAAFPALPAIAGVDLATHNTGLRYQGRPDLLVVRLAAGSTGAGVFTRSKTRSAPVDWCRRALAAGGGAARGLVVNSGNANAFTGSRGIASVERTIASAAMALSCPPEEVFIASTGTIGVPLDDAKITTLIDAIAPSLGTATWFDAATAISTTDTYPKGATRTATIDGVSVTLSGIAKGSGMIAPDMATMLAYVFTDAALPAGVLQDLLTQGVERSFNAITVDGDTSTSDSLMLFATGKAGNAPVQTAIDRRLSGFRKALFALLTDLAHQVVRDGEGATKFVTVTVTGAKSPRAAKRIGLAIANSPLVKTAIAGEDANWGRIVMAVGKSGEEADRDRLEIRIGGHLIAAEGQAVADYDEGPVATHMKGTDVDIAVDLGLGRGKATVWTCDLTHGYIDINADYRT
ncbi:bifunctional ornithine acetyltransferase/N-acetylglutamate synthase [Rhodospirillum rubrum]|uniref:bifunctional glutamate N-acetyltransferase/amino-acid acetyltransferase ArgJ n=1 Tax=Rhodospirillum rubrum TaxID=1085 RepID=UPI0019062D02|nr:bifunctional glutamate N-acetyltransferase/amino-acid acetyltransferase ArgJ [Rhodospirillum rubrum]MBK1663733.1 bifunctional ornithine acetyltransferase/N-acetylglutamate synthase [Rhodospirillum rubrum]MBK1676484.1 bifunctional ornithine acetyltransferase/N-acetylglutamate synthase [Rhodospirillum rubrum]